MALLSRKDLAAALGVSPGEIARREKMGYFAPVKRENGTYLYDESVLLHEKVSPRKYGIGRKSRENLRGLVRKPKFEGINYLKLTGYAASEAKRVFIALFDNTPLASIVAELGIHPSAVRAICKEYEEMTGSVVIHGPVMKQINALTTLDGNFPLAKEEDILTVLTASAESSCDHCHKRAKMVCRHCVPAIADDMET